MAVLVLSTEDTPLAPNPNPPPVPTQRLRGRGALDTGTCKHLKGFSARLGVTDGISLPMASLFSFLLFSSLAAALILGQVVFRELSFSLCQCSLFLQRAPAGSAVPEGWRLLLGASLQ